MAKAAQDVPNHRQRRGTATSTFGVSRRESHDASAFYDRFPPPVLDGADIVAAPATRDRIWVGDARHMDECGDIVDDSVALVVTSPPYFAGKDYETEIGEGHVPASYIAYLEMLHDVFAACVRKLEPGGRIAVNVANLGRKPYRSLSADVIDIFQELGLLLRGEVIWQKARGAGGNCAWGSFQRPGNPVLRDLTERVIVASKGRFDRAVDARTRAARGLPSQATITADEFMELTTDVWELAPESAVRVGHPAPFPVELPRMLIDLYTYQGDLVLDPFMGSGSTAVAAVRTGRHFVGFDTDADYVAQSLTRVDDERSGNGAPGPGPRMGGGLTSGVVGGDGESTGFDGRAEVADDPVVAAVAAGRRVKDVARLVLETAGFVDVVNDAKVAGVDVSFRATDARGDIWYADLHGAFASGRPGLRRTETLWRALGKASVVAATEPEARLLLLSTDLPAPRSAAGRGLAAVCGRGPGKTVVDVIRLLDADDAARLGALAAGADSAEG